MGSRRPTLQKKLLAWLLGPLLGLLIVDTLVTYSTSSGFSNHAYDRSLEEMAREVLLHVRPGAARPVFEMPAEAERILRVDQDDRIFFRVSAGCTASRCGWWPRRWRWTDSPLQWCRSPKP